MSEEIMCQREGCTVVFEKRTFNNIYHDAECTRLATNAKIMEKYYARRAQRRGEARFCAKCLTQTLSRYNSGIICNACKQESTENKNKSVADMLGDINWIA